MLTEIRLRNFKAFGAAGQTIGLSRINVFIGENGTGKSSVLQALSLLGQSAGEPRLKSSKFQFADYLDLVHLMRRGVRAALGFTGETSQETGDGRAQFTYSVAFDDAGVVVDQEGQITIHSWPALPKGLTLTGKYKYGDRLAEPDRVGGASAHRNLGATERICYPIQTTGGRHDSTEAGRQEYETLDGNLRPLLNCFSSAVRNAFVVRTMRGFDNLDYNLGDRASDEPTDGQAVVSTYAYRREVEAKVADWLEEVTGVRIAVHLVPDKRASLRSAEGYNIYHEGFGTNQLVWPLLQIAIAPEDSLVGVEEAEIHLHPKAQLRLCKVLAEAAKKENEQLVLTTHSDHLLSGFLNIVAEGGIKPQDLSVYFFEKKDDAASATQLKVDEKGRLEGGLRGFAEVELEKLKSRAAALGAKHGRR